MITPIFRIRSSLPAARPAAAAPGHAKGKIISVTESDTPHSQTRAAASVIGSSSIGVWPRLITDFTNVALIQQDIGSFERADPMYHAGSIGLEPYVRHVRPKQWGSPTS